MVHFVVFGRARPSHIAAANSASRNGNDTVVHADPAWKASAEGLDDDIRIERWTPGRHPVFGQRERRIEAVLLDGGWYCDTDVLVLIRLPDPETFTAGLEARDCVCAGIFGAPAGHRVVADWLGRLRVVPKADFTHWTDQNLMHSCLDDECRILPVEALHYLSLTDFYGRIRLTPEQCRLVEDRSWAIHYYSKGWRSKWSDKRKRKLETRRLYRNADIGTIHSLAARGDWLAGMLQKYLKST